MLAATGGAATGFTEILHAASVLLVPYCAKPPQCPWRHRDGCGECGDCEVGEAYRLGRERGMRVVSITDFEHLRATLAALKRAGVTACIGMCCQQFFIKRHHAFADAGIPMLLLDINATTCYELGQEEQAYAGRFEAQARLDPELLTQVLRQVPAGPAPTPA
jgi:lipoate-protein ligase A